MKQLSLIFISAFLCFSLLVPLTQAQDAETPEELSARKAHLEKEQGQLEQRLLLAQRENKPEEVSKIEGQQKQIAQQLKEVSEEESKAVPAFPPSTPSNQVPIVVAKAGSEQEVLQASDITSWQKAWETFAEQPGRIWGKGGALFVATPPEERAQHIIEIVEKLPASFGANQSIDALSLIAQQALDMKNKNYFTPDEADHDYGQIIKALAKKLDQVIENSQFKNQEPEQVNELIITILKKIKVGPQFKNSIEIMITRKIIDYLQTAGLKEGSSNISQNFTDVISDYLGISKGLMLSEIHHHAIQNALAEIIEKITKPVDALSFEQGLNTLENIAKSEKAETLSKQMPKLSHIFVITANRLLSNELSNHSLTRDISPLTQPGQTEEQKEALYLNAYVKEVDLLNKYLIFTKKNGASKTDPEFQAAARRLSRVNDFMNEQKDLPETQANKQLFNKLNKAIFKVLDTLVDEGGIMGVLEHDTEFESKEEEQSKLFNRLSALPEDMLAGMNQEATSVLEQMSKTTDPKRLKELYDNLEAIYVNLTQPLIEEKDKSYDLKDLLIESADLANLSKLTEQIEKALGPRKEVLQKNVKRLVTIRDRFNEILPKLKESSLANITAHGKELGQQKQDLEKITEYAVPEGMVPEFQRTYGQVEAWTDIIDAAEAYKALTSASAQLSEQEKATVGQVYVTVTKAFAGIPVSLDYDQEKIFTDRLEAMKKQQEALDKLTSLVREPKATIGGKEYDLLQVAGFIKKLAYRFEKLSAQQLDDLEKSGFLIHDVREGQTYYRPSDRGLYLVSIADTLNDVERRAKQLDEYQKQHASGIEPSLQRLSPTGRPIEIAEAYRLQLLILDDQVDVLQYLYRRNILENKVEEAVSGVVNTTAINNPPPLAKIDKTELLNDISDLLSVARAELRKESVNPYFESLVESEAYIESLPQKEQAETRKAAGLTTWIMRIIGLSDPEAVFTADEATITEEVKDIYTKLKSAVNASLADLAARWKQAMIAGKETASKVAWYSAIPAAVVAFFATKITVQAGAPIIGGTLGSAIGPVGTVAGATIGSMVGGVTGDIAALFAGAGAGASLYLLYATLKPTEQDYEKLNELLFKAGYVPEYIQKDPGLWNKAVEKMKSLFSSEVTNMVRNAEKVKEGVDQKIAWATKAQEELYAQLGIEPNARATAVEAGFKQKEEALKGRLFLNRWLTKKNLTRDYRRMLKCHIEARRAQIEYNSVLVDIATKIMADVARENTGILDGIWNLIWGAKEGTQEKPTADKLIQTARDTIDVYRRQVADLIALESMIEKEAGDIGKADPFGKGNTLIDAFRDQFNSRVKDLEISYVDNVNLLLESQGKKTLSLPT